MNVKETARKIRRNLEAFAYAFDYDPHVDMSSRIERLERDNQSQKARLAALSEEVCNLSEQMRQGI